MEDKSWYSVIKKEGRAKIREGSGRIMEWVDWEHWEQEKDSSDGIFLLYDLFQIRTIAPVFSEVSLDIVEFATNPVIYHTPANQFLEKGPISNGIVKFAIIKEAFWKKLLFQTGRLVVLQEANDDQGANEVMEEKFPLWVPQVKEIYLDAEGVVKIIKG